MIMTMTHMASNFVCAYCTDLNSPKLNCQTLPTDGSESFAGLFFSDLLVKDFVQNSKDLVFGFTDFNHQAISSHCTRMSEA